MNSQIFVEGNPADLPDLEAVAFNGYAHFTAMQVRDGRVRGLDLHLQRLREASETLFGRSRSDEGILDDLRRAVANGPADASISVYLAADPGEFTGPDPASRIRTYLRVSTPAEPPPGPLRLLAVEYERVLPQIKHVGEVAKTWFLRRAVARGFDDALFVDRRGRIGEATIWNLVWWDGSTVLWPAAPVLNGVTRQIVARQLVAIGIPQAVVPIGPADLTHQMSAAVMNSWSPGIGVTGIGADEDGERTLGDATELLELLHRAYEAEPLKPV